MKYLIAGILFIIIGIIVRFFPSILSGYSSLSQRDIENFKNNRGSLILSIVFIIMGALSSSVFFISSYFDIESFQKSFLIFLTLIGAILIIYLSNFYSNSKR